MYECRNICDALEKYFTNYGGINVIRLNRTIGIEIFDSITSSFFIEVKKIDITNEVELLDIDNENACLVIYSKNTRNEYISVLIVFKFKRQDLILFFSHTSMKIGVAYVKEIMESENPSLANYAYYSSSIPYSIDMLPENGLILKEVITKTSFESDRKTLENRITNCFKMYYLISRY